MGGRAPIGFEDHADCIRVAAERNAVARRRIACDRNHSATVAIANYFAVRNQNCGSGASSPRTRPSTVGNSLLWSFSRTRTIFERGHCSQGRLVGAVKIDNRVGMLRELTQRFPSIVAPNPIYFSRITGDTFKFSLERLHKFLLTPLSWRPLLRRWINGRSRSMAHDNETGVAGLLFASWMVHFRGVGARGHQRAVDDYDRLFLRALNQAPALRV